MHREKLTWQVEDCVADLKVMQKLSLRTKRFENNGSLETNGTRSESGSSEMIHSTRNVPAIFEFQGVAEAF